MAIRNGTKSGRRDETLVDDEISVYDEGTKDYIESNRLLDYISEFLWKAREKADRPVLVNGLNETKPSFNYDTYYGGKVVRRRASAYGFAYPHEEEERQTLEKETYSEPIPHKSNKDI